MGSIPSVGKAYPYSAHHGPICLADEPYFRRMRERRERAIASLEARGLRADNLGSWPNDCLRHCFASYHCTQFGDSRRTSQEMGHSGGLTVFNYHYRNRVKPADAQAFWQLPPPAAPAAFSLSAEATAPASALSGPL